MRFNIVHVSINDHKAIFEDLIIASLGAFHDLGIPCTRTENAPLEGAVNLLIGSLPPASDWLIGQLKPESYLVYQMEQLAADRGHLPNYPRYLDLLKNASHVWDYSRTNIERLERMGVTGGIHVPAGYHRSLEVMRHDRPKDIDVLFYGSASPRRDRIIAALRERGVAATVLFGAYGQARNSVIERAKIVLNVHCFDIDTLEEVRLSYLLANRCFVVSEKSDHNPYGEGVAFCSHEQLVDSCLHYLQAGDEVRRGIAERGYRAVRRLDCTAAVKAALQKLPSAFSDLDQPAMRPIAGDAEREPFPVAQAIQAGVERHQAGKLAEAEHIYRRVLKFDPANADALHLLGILASQHGNTTLAVELIAKAIGVQPDNPGFLNNFGNALKDAGRHAEAEQSYRRALALKPDYAEAHANLAILLHALRRPREAEQGFRRALELKPDYPEAHNSLGAALHELGRPEEAEQHFRRALELRPGYVEAQNNLGEALRSQRRLTEAAQCFRDAVARKPGLAIAYNNLANVLRSLGLLEEAGQNYRRALALEPDNAATHSNLVFLLNYIPGLDAAAIFAEHRAFARRFCATAKPVPHGNIPKPGRKLRIGYVSGDLRDHPVAFFLEPVLARHDRKKFEIYCYYNFARADAATERLRSLADHWRDVIALDDAALANRVREDAIDILVDLAGHTGHSRLLAFGRKPAPVQASWLGYLNTTGLEAIDYRITDAHASPEGPLDALHTEKLVRLPDSQWCYRPPAECPEVAPPPCVASGRVTFASFTNPAKIGRTTIELWARLLERLPGSRLLVVGATLISIPDEYLERFTRAGIAPGRLQVLGAKPFLEYLALHGAADIVLDTFPYSGGTTTCHALWMGVPVVTLAGETAASRGGASLLHAVGLGQLVAQTPEQYLDIAAALAADPKRLAALRAGMRRRMSASPLMDEERFTRNLEKAYRKMWRTWCAKQPS